MIFKKIKIDNNKILKLDIGLRENFFFEAIILQNFDYNMQSYIMSSFRLLSLERLPVSFGLKIYA